jgi:hypothetical protein
MGMTILHVVVAALVGWFIGAAWYSPFMFAKAWVKAHGYTPEHITAMQGMAGRTYSLTLLAMILMAAVLQLFLNHLGVTSLHGGVMWSFHAWLGFAVPLGFIAHLYAQKSWAAYFIDVGYQLVYIVAMGAILGVWQ